MPTRKQRRRREKSFRHEWEYVEVDPETGEERTVALAELKPERPERPVQAGGQAAKARGKGGKPQGRRGREVEPPSWRKVLKRTAFFAPLMAGFMYWTSSSSKNGASATGIALNTVILIAFFAPFSYFVDSITHRVYTKRQRAQKG